MGKVCISVNNTKKWMVGTLLVLSEEIPRKLSEKVASNLFVQGGDLSQNSKAAAKEWQKRKIKLLSIPPHSADINPIENMFNLIDRKLKSDGIEQNITHETYEQFSVRAQNFLENYPIAEIDKIVDTKPERMHQIINCNGGRLRY